MRRKKDLMKNTLGKVCLSVGGLGLGKVLTIKFDSLGSELDLGNDLLELGLVDDGVEPAVGVVVWLAELLVGNVLVGQEQVSSDSDVGQGDALSNQVGASLQVVVETGEHLLQVLFGTLYVLLGGLS